MPKKIYNTEREGQMDFFDNYRIPYNDDSSVLVDNTDGVYHGNLLEFKLNIQSVGKVLFQAVKYLSKMRIRGESVPARILLIDLNATKVYVFKSENYKAAIQKVYAGSASKNNDGFAENASPNAVYDYSDMADSSEIMKLLKNRPETNANWYMPVDLDENCVVGWAERYYKELPNASKGDFLGDGTGKINITGEIRDPKHFRNLIRPYTEKTNERFAYLMDCLNSKLAKKSLGAFFTPEIYCRKSRELVMKAVERVPDGNDYIILDRAAGSGNLESTLIGLKDRNGDELISHCVVSTYEYYEYKVLMERVGDLVRDVIPPTEANICFENGVISNADAMSEEYVNNPIIRKYVENEKCTIILYENPPYQDSTAITFTEKDGSRAKTQSTSSFVNKEYRAHSSEMNESKASAREISNLFIWSGFHYYLRQDTDSYILFSPIKYWKNVGLANKKFGGGYLFNRKHFHATESSIGCCLWENIPIKENTITVEAFDIKDGILVHNKRITLKKSYRTFLDYYDKRTFPTDEKTKVWVAREGTELNNPKADIPAIWNDNIIGNLGAPAFALDAKNRYLVRGSYYHHGCVFILRKDNYKIKLPLWVAKCFPQDNWYEKDVYNTTSDGGNAYTHDELFLKRCLLYTVLSNQNKCLSFTGSDGRYYRNELTLDDTNGDTCASADLAKLFAKYPPDCDEQELINLWNNVMEEAKKTVGYDSSLTYGVYQITKELNTSYKEGSGRNKRTIYDYPVLNGYLVALRDRLKAYYKSHITDLMFKYELLK